MLYTKKMLTVSIMAGALSTGFGGHAFAQSAVTSSIVVKNTISGSYAITPAGTNGGCHATIGSGGASCPGFINPVSVNSSFSGVATFQASDAYNTLYNADVLYYLNATDPGINMASGTSCSWQIQIIKQLSQSGQPWQGNVRYTGSQDTNLPFVPACVYSDFSVNRSTGQFSIVLSFGGS